MLNAGPGKAWSAKEQGQYLFQLAGKKERFISAPIGLMDGVISCFDGLARIFPNLEVTSPQNLTLKLLCLTLYSGHAAVRFDVLNALRVSLMLCCFHVAEMTEICHVAARFS